MQARNNTPDFHFHRDTWTKILLQLGSQEIIKKRLISRDFRNLINTQDFWQCVAVQNNLRLNPALPLEGALEWRQLVQAHERYQRVASEKCQAEVLANQENTELAAELATEKEINTMASRIGNNTGYIMPLQTRTGWLICLALSATSLVGSTGLSILLCNNWIWGTLIGCSMGAPGAWMGTKYGERTLKERRIKHYQQKVAQHTKFLDEHSPLLISTTQASPETHVMTKK